MKLIFYALMSALVYASPSSMRETFNNYLACRPKSKDVVPCVKPWVVAGDEERHKRLAAWLLIAPVVKGVRDCKPDELAKSRRFPDRTDLALCFEMLNSTGQPIVGRAFFKEKAQKYFLFSFDY